MQKTIPSWKWERLGYIDKIIVSLAVEYKLMLLSFHIWRRAWEILPMPFKFSATASIFSLGSLWVLPSHPLAILGAFVIGLFCAFVALAISQIRASKKQNRARNTQF